MTAIEDILERYRGEVSQYLATTTATIFVHCAADLTILAHNAAFSSLVLDKRDCVGLSFSSFLQPESAAVLPLPEGEGPLSTGLNFQLKEDVVPLACMVFRLADSQHLVLGAAAAAVGDDTMLQMSVLTNEMVNISRDLQRKNHELQEARKRLDLLGEIIPICMHCKGIRDDKGYWKQVETFIADHTNAQLSHGICESCMAKLHPKAFQRYLAKQQNDPPKP